MRARAERCGAASRKTSAGVVGLCLGFTAALGLAQEVRAQAGNTISVPIAGLHSSDGEVRCGLYNSADGFREPGRQMMGVAAPIKNEQATCVFSKVPPGTYAVAVFHAEKGETEISYGLFGRPKQGFGFSRNPSTTFGAPSFSAAAFAYKGGAASSPVTLSY